MPSTTHGRKLFFTILPLQERKQVPGDWVNFHTDAKTDYTGWLKIWKKFCHLAFIHDLNLAYKLCWISGCQCYNQRIFNQSIEFSVIREQFSEILQRRFCTSREGQEAQLITPLNAMNKFHLTSLSVAENWRVNTTALVFNDLVNKSLIKKYSCNSLCVSVPSNYRYVFSGK